MQNEKNDKVQFEIVQNIACLSTESKGWVKEINLVSWNGREPKYDIRMWAENHSRMGKGVTLTEDELRMLKDVLVELL